MTNGLARASIRFRPASFVGSLVALVFSVTIVTACGILLQTGITASVPPQRYAHTPVVVAGDQYARIDAAHADETEDVALPERDRVPAATAARIAQLPTVAAAVPDVAFPLQSTVPGSAPLPDLTGRNIAASGIPAPDAPAPGCVPGPGEVVLDRNSAHAAGLAVGDHVALTAPGGSGTYRVCGLAPDRGDGASAWFAGPVADRLSGHPGTVDAVAVRPRPGVTTGELATRVREVLDGRAEVFTGDDRGEVEEPGLADGRTLLLGLGGSFGGIAATTAVFVVIGTIALAVGQRAREFALLRAVGATPRQIRRTVAAEALMLAPVAGALGVWPGVALAHWWFGQLVDRGAVPEQVRLDVGFLPMVVAVGLVALAALLAGWVAGRRPARLRPSQALGEAALERAWPGVVRTVLGVAFAVGGTVLATVAADLDGEDAANTALGVVMCFLAAVALLGPLLVRLLVVVLGLPARACSVAGSLAADNVRAQARGFASAVIPIAMVTAFCGTLVFLQTTVRHVSDEHVRDAVVADHVLSPTGPGLPDTVAERAADLPGVRTATGVLRTGVLYQSGGALNSATALGVSGDPAALPDVLDLDVTSGSLARLTPDARTVAVDALLADSLGVSTGDRLSLRLGDGTRARPTVVAVYQRGLGLGDVLFSRDALTTHVTAALDDQVLVTDSGDADHAAVAHALAELTLAASVTDAAGYRAQADRDQELNAWANYVMAAVLGGFAALAAGNTLVMTVLQRRRELALLRLTGTTRRQVRGMVRFEALLVAATGLLLGGVIAWTTLVPVTRGLTGEGPHVPAGTALLLSAGVVLLTLVTTALPTRALLRGNPVAPGG
ncbi:ABC transporter permease [Wenjunlia vitaminophila]|uniref:ABC transporter permease n=1 Tax=Wenjunlia vitaminophila TaxID=76728 RepID=A0A0T6LL26_WENVI|nr:FtsX-like permease family protein [Wenjunlia vitaminophila]KRV46562.1 ABC transporter permease [Wenjunlia vitaminophila]